MKSWLIESGSEKCRWFQINWEMESSNPGPSSEVGTKSRQGVDLRKRQWAGCRSQLCLPETLGELLPTFRPSVEWESGIQWSPRPLPYLAFWESCISIQYPGKEGIMISWSRVDYRSLVRSDSCSPPLPFLVLQPHWFACISSNLPQFFPPQGFGWFLPSRILFPFSSPGQ